MQTLLESFFVSGFGFLFRVFDVFGLFYVVLLFF